MLSIYLHQVISIFKKQSFSFSAGHTGVSWGKDAGAIVLGDVESGRGICCAGYLGRILDVALPSHNKLLLGLPFHMGQRVERTHLMILHFYQGLVTLFSERYTILHCLWHGIDPELQESELKSPFGVFHQFRIISRTSSNIDSARPYGTSGSATWTAV